MDAGGGCFRRAQSAAVSASSSHPSVGRGEFDRDPISWRPAPILWIGDVARSTRGGRRTALMPSAAP